MQIFSVPPQGFAANTYILTQDGENAVVIDPAQPRAENELTKRRLACAYVLLTHAHFDHTGGVGALQRKGAKVLCSAEEASLVGTDADLCEAFGAPPRDFRADGTFEDGESKTLCGLKVTAVFTPGHTSGSVCYLVQDEKTGDRALFTGDTLFAGSIGRTDFPTGSDGAMRKSLGKLLSLFDDVDIYPGHGEKSSLSAERKDNVFLTGL